MRCIVSLFLCQLRSLIQRTVVFFFQAEDGIRDGTGTGVQTCALPISVEAVSRKLLGELARPFAIATGGVQVTASIGISTLPDDAVDATALMKHADTAMYTAKQAGKNTLQFYRAAVANDPQARQASAADRD